MLSNLGQYTYYPDCHQTGILVSRITHILSTYINIQWFWRDFWIDFRDYCLLGSLICSIYSIKVMMLVTRQVYLSQGSPISYLHIHWRQMGLKKGGAEWEFETYLLKFETYLILRDYETEKTTGAPAPAAPASLAPMHIQNRHLYYI